MHAHLQVSKGLRQHPQLLNMCAVGFFAASDSATVGFPSESLVQSKALLLLRSIRDSERTQRIFPDIRFSCSGSVTKWILVLEAGGGSMEYPQLQIWREEEGSGSYQRVGYTDIKYLSSSITDTYTVVEYSLTTPLAFQEGDILGAHQPRRSDSDVVMQFQERGLLVSYRHDKEDNPLETFVIDEAKTDQTDYPLVGVETSK